jgi:Flp pilus assembly protein TadB
METIVDFTQWVIWIACAVVLATMLAEMVLKTYLLIKIKKYQTELQPVLDVMERAVAGQLILLTVEVDHNQYLCYNALTQEFVCQGIDVTEIVQRFRARFPDKSLTIFNGDDTAVETLQQQSRAQHENLNLQ